MACLFCCWFGCGVCLGVVCWIVKFVLRCWNVRVLLFVWLGLSVYLGSNYCCLFGCICIIYLFLFEFVLLRWFWVVWFDWFCVFEFCALDWLCLFWIWIWFGFCFNLLLGVIVLVFCLLFTCWVVLGCCCFNSLWMVCFG